MRYIHHSSEAQDAPLTIKEQAAPEPARGEVVIETAAAGINRADLAQRAGVYPPPSGASPILGLEVSGTVVAAAQDVTEFRVGDKVVALLAGGGYAEQVACPVEQVLPAPEGIDLVQAAAIPETYATAFLNLVMLGNLKPVHRVLIHAGASGVGISAVHLCKLMGVKAVATTSSAGKVDACLAAGADVAVARDGGTEAMFADLKKETDGQPFDVILDPVGSAYLPHNLRVLSVEGSIIIIATLSGNVCELPLGLVLMKRARIIGSTIRALTPARKYRILRDLHQFSWQAFEAGTTAPVIDRVFPFAEAEEAHRLMASNSNTGKFLLVP